MSIDETEKSDEHMEAALRVARIDEDEKPDERTIARLRLLLIDLESAYESGDVLKAMGRADYLRDASLSLVNTLLLQARQLDASGKAPYTLEQAGQVLGLSKQAVADRVRRCGSSASVAEADEPMTAATVTLGLTGAELHEDTKTDRYGVELELVRFGVVDLFALVRSHPGVAEAVKACETLHLDHWLRIGPADLIPQDFYADTPRRVVGARQPDPLLYELAGQWEIQLDQAQMGTLREAVTESAAT
ncbi:hypothetical protein Stsp01_66510 [Streptomyces sp. NBRC 13847]|uniref:hypothetical protein n=1 Tax=Streptomyces TaxID=1883 RepID=UPI0024A51A36|nr:hypothetical protein [Streptomyces sp. NBRC 13847]GLW19908.1 hypothetical protein Stsp01_66510 [Streptomyces sp. NBRC 13847]